MTAMTESVSSGQATELLRWLRMRADCQQWLGFIGMVFGIFMAVLDIQIVASSLEQIQAGLSATREEITWVQSAYLVAEVVVIPLSGWLARACRLVTCSCCPAAIHTDESALCLVVGFAVDGGVPRLAGLFGGR